MDTVRKFMDKCNIDGRVLYDQSMAQHTSFHIGGPADAFVLPSTGAELARLMEAALADGIACTVIGGGANLLVADAGLRGIVACTSLLKGIEHRQQADGSVLVRAQAGLPVTELVRYTLEHELAGLEFAAGLPGFVGGAAYMNA
ncbi:MAG TPA: FAD-binding protein, partial [Spirochaetales bacterium]|nr:FAD-binding protein [Spirochaetales bacterium]